MLKCMCSIVIVSRLLFDHITKTRQCNMQIFLLSVKIGGGGGVGSVDFLHTLAISVQNIECWYTLEPHHRSGPNVHRCEQK